MNETIMRRTSGGLERPVQGFNRVSGCDRPVFQILLAEHLSGEAVWIDSGNEASTYALSSAGSSELLERVVIGRAFTAFQHYHLVNRIEEFVTEDTEFIVLPNIDQQYVEGNVTEKEAGDLFEEVASKLQSVRKEKDVKILYSLYGSGLEASEMNRLEDNYIKVKSTSEGLKSRGKNVYRHGRTVQTTIGLWNSENDATEVKNDGKNELDLQEPLG